MSHAYQQLELDVPSRAYTTINTRRGLFAYTRLPFGVSASPGIFQRTIENVLQGIPHVCVYLDDLLITGKSEEQHLETLELVLQIKSNQIKSKDFIVPNTLLVYGFVLQ